MMVSLYEVDDQADKLLKELNFTNVEDQAAHLTNFLICEPVLTDLVKHIDDPTLKNKFYNLILSHLKVAQDRVK